jgi:hypothetical protein
VRGRGADTGSCPLGPFTLGGVTLATGNIGSVESASLAGRDGLPARRIADAAWRRVLLPLRHRSGLGLGYAGVVLVVAIVVALLPDPARHRIVLDASTNLVNLHRDPLLVLAASAYVVAPLTGLWILAPLMIVYGAAQRWLGAAATVVVAVLGHVGATLTVAVLLAAGLHHGRLDPSVARAQDVGVSYGLVAVAAVLTARLPPGRLRWGYAAALLAYCAGPALVAPDFADLGHTVAALIGFAVALVATSAASPERTNPG